MHKLDEEVFNISNQTHKIYLKRKLRLIYLIDVKARVLLFKNMQIYTLNFVI